MIVGLSALICFRIKYAGGNRHSTSTCRRCHAMWVIGRLDGSVVILVAIGPAVARRLRRRHLLVVRHQRDAIRTCQISTSDSVCH